MLSGNKVAYPRFPEYLKTYGTYRKNARLVQELKKSLWCPGIEANAVIGEFAPILYKLIVTPMKMKL